MIKQYFNDVVLHNFKAFFEQGPIKMALCVALVVFMVLFMVPNAPARASETSGSGATTSEQWTVDEGLTPEQKTAEENALKVVKLLKIGVCLIIAVLIILLVFGGAK